MYQVELRYWAGAETAAGCTNETLAAETVAAALAKAKERRASNREFERVLAVASYLVDGVRRDRATFDEPLTEKLVVEVLPPFAGG